MLGSIKKSSLHPFLESVAKRDASNAHITDYFSDDLFEAEVAFKIEAECNAVLNGGPGVSGLNVAAEAEYFWEESYLELLGPRL